MKLTLRVDTDYFDRLSSPSERQSLEVEMGYILGRCKIIEMKNGHRTWRNGGNGKLTATVQKSAIQRIELAELPQEAYGEGATCSLTGG